MFDNSNFVSYGTYHQARIQKYGQQVGEGDTIGVLVDMDKRTIRFSVNGIMYGIAYGNLPSPLYPAFSILIVSNMLTLQISSLG
jgi:hypothetical protein